MATVATTFRSDGGATAALGTEAPWREVWRSLVPMFTESAQLPASDGVRAHQAGGSIREPEGLLVAMLAALDTCAGQTVLVVGAGIGAGTRHLMTAMLCRMLGDKAVALTLPDATEVFTARASLNSAGFRPSVIGADGLQGYPRAAPYDRILVLGSPWTVPDAWITQTRAGGLIVTPLGAHGDTVWMLRVAEEQSGATGQLLDAALLPGTFRPLCPTEVLQPLALGSEELPPAHSDRSVSAVTLNAILGADGAFSSLLHLVAPDLDHHHVTLSPGTGLAHVWIDRSPTRSWARLDRDGSLTGGGPRDLATGLLGIVEWWTSVGMPRPGRWSLTIQPGQSCSSATASTLAAPRTVSGAALWVDRPVGHRLVIPMR